MHLPKFEYFRPSNLEEVISLLKVSGSDAKAFAGGTDLFPRMKHGLIRPKKLVSLKWIPVRPPYLSEDGGRLFVDARMPLSEVTRSPLVRKEAPLLAEAAGRVASEEIRNMGTLGGNVCQDSRCHYYNQSHSFQFLEPCFKRGGSFCYFLAKGKECVAVYMADTAPALICLDAQIDVLNPDSPRQMPLENLYSGNAARPFKLRNDEIITQVIIPSRPESSGWSFRKFSPRGGLEFAAVSIAVRLQMERKGLKCRSAGLVVGSISFSPLRASKAESLLNGETLSDQLIEEVSRVTADEIDITPHHDYSRRFLKDILRVETKRALVTALNSCQR